MGVKTGWLVLVVGPSGAGKDSVLQGAATALSSDPRFVFPRRVVTRTADVNAEDHVSVTEAAFSEAEESGAYILSWRAHGNSYGISTSVTQDIAAEKIVAINVSRHVLAKAVSLFPDVLVVNITADAEVRKSRILSRGREQSEDGARRMARETPAFPFDATVVQIVNNGALALAVDSFVSALKRL
jgi:ribose 1,5-bisphosphokinase